MYKVIHIGRPSAGVGVYLNLLVKHIDNTKFENIVFCNKKDNIIDLYDKTGIEITKYHINLKRELNLINDFKCLLQIIRLLKKNKPDIIHCHSAKAGILGRLAGAFLKIPTLYTPHAFSYLSGESKAKKLVFKYFEKILSFFPAKILACSDSEYKRAAEDLNFKNKNILLWKNSIEDISKIKTYSILDKLPEFYICSIGRPSYQKNIEMLINVVEKIKIEFENIHLVLLGIGLYSPTIENIKKIIQNKELRDNFSLIPWLKREESLAVLNNSYLYVSTSRYEGLPYSLIEAISLAKPCVVTNVDGNKDVIINNLNGFLINDFNEDTMADKIILILKNKNIHANLSKNSRYEYEKNYNISKNIILLESIYQSEINSY